MIHIKYKLDKSAIHGIGLFTDQNINQDEIIYTASPVLDTNITQEDFDALNEKEKSEVRWWGFYDEPTQKWHVDFDVSKFINHSYDANVTQDGNHDEAYLVAKRYIKKGEELTQNYLEFEGQAELEQRGIIHNT
jgi:SET domain-containing protein